MKQTRSCLSAVGFAVPRDMSVPYGSYAPMAKSSRGWMGGKVKVRQLGIRACETERALGLEDTDFKRDFSQQCAAAAGYKGGELY